MGPLIISALAGKLESQLMSLAGPAPAAGASMWRAKAGISDQAAARAAEYFGQAASVADRGSKFYAPLSPDPNELITLYHQDAGKNSLSLLNQFGIDVTQAGDTDGTVESDCWTAIVNFASTAGPIDVAVRQFWRESNGPDQPATGAETELLFQFARGGYSRQGDRNLVTSPYYSWSIEDAQRLVWMGLADPVAYGNLLGAAGCAHAEDATFAQQLSQYYPSPSELAAWDARGLAGGADADPYGFLGGGAIGGVGSFFAAIQGVGAANIPLPGQPDIVPNWYDLMVRSNRPIPGYGELRAMSHRLRQAEAGFAASVVPGANAVGPDMVAAALRLQGFSETSVNAFVGMLPEPINIRIINHVLTETLKHKDLAQQADAALGGNGDWVVSAFLDHGFTPAVAQVTAAAIRQAAWDAANAEKLEIQKQLRTEARALTMRMYEAGLVDDATAVSQLQGDFVDEAMATQMVGMAVSKLQLDATQATVAEIKTAFFDGKLSWAQVAGQFQVLGINAARIAYYAQEWAWARNDRVRMLSTGEILQALKAGLMTPDVALARLTNLGWTAPDALVEINMIIGELEASQARAAAAAQAKAISEEQRAARAKAAADKAAAAEAQRAAREAAKLAAQEGRAPLEQEAAITRYTALALLDLDAYNAAAAKGETNKMNAEIAKATHAYQELLLEQIRLAEISPKVADETKQIVPVAVPPPPASP